jgi:hypothetical protein
VLSRRRSPIHDGLVLTESASEAARVAAQADHTVQRRLELIESGCTASAQRAQLDAGRWQRMGRAIVLHNGPLTRAETRRVVLLNCGPRAVFTAFTAAEAAGLKGWERDETHVLVPPGVERPRIALPYRLHRTSDWDDWLTTVAGRRRHLGRALVIAASSFRLPRVAAGLLAASVQQRLVTPDRLRAAVIAAPRTRHRAALIAAIDDIAMGAHALSEIDFARLCRGARLPEPIRQSVRLESGGRRRYPDAEWELVDGRRVVAEVDGAVHLVPRRWFDDQLRQNELALSGSMLLRFPSVVVRHEPALVIAQLRRALRS